MSNNSANSPGVEQSGRVSPYYDANYWTWQKDVGVVGGWANKHKFRDTVHPEDCVVDFGCGGGFLLANLTCGRRVGIEPNEAVRAQLLEHGIVHFETSVAASSALGVGFADIVISNHALEHALNPLQELRDLWQLLKPGGRIHFYVPCDNVHRKYSPLDSNRHLFSWSPSNLGNLFAEAGYQVEVAEPYFHKWPPKYQAFARLGEPIFHLISRIWGLLDRSWVQVQVRATKPQILN